MLRRYMRTKRPMLVFACAPDAHHPLAGVEFELLHDRAADDDHRLPPGRRSAVLDAVQGIAHRFEDRDQHRHVFRPAARHHAGHGDAENRRFAPFLRYHAYHFFRLAVGELQERVHALARGRHDGQSVGPQFPVKMLLHFVERAAEDDLSRFGLGLGVGFARGFPGQSPQQARRQLFLDFALELFLAVDHGRAGIDADCERQARGPSRSPRPASRNPEPMMEAVGMPIFSTIAEARNTAGVQLPQAPMPTIAASALCARSLSGIVAVTWCSRAPWKLPNSS